jgi:uncharacterized protein (TIGR02246 family)
MRISGMAVATIAALLAACGSSDRFDPEDPAAVAAIDSIMQEAMVGAREVDADRVLAMAEGGRDLTFITGEVLLSGLDTIRAAFEDTYAGLARQDQTVLEKRIRLLTPDVALVTTIGEGTYTDRAGWTSEPAGIGLSIVFVRENGVWRARHAHQSIVR